MTYNVRMFSSFFIKNSDANRAPKGRKSKNQLNHWLAIHTKYEHKKSTTNAQKLTLTLCFLLRWSLRYLRAPNARPHWPQTNFLLSSSPEVVVNADFADATLPSLSGETCGATSSDVDAVEAKFLGWGEDAANNGGEGRDNLLSIWEGTNNWKCLRKWMTSSWETYGSLTTKKGMWRLFIGAFTKVMRALLRTAIQRTF